MNLTLFFRAILVGAFQTMTKYYCKDNPEYSKRLFYVPVIYAIDQNFHVSLQIHHGNYCSSENGFREFGFTFHEIEFGFPSIADDLFAEYAEDKNNICGTVGCIPTEVMEQIFAKYGGIDWEKTLSVESLEPILFES